MIDLEKTLTWILVIYFLTVRWLHDFALATPVGFGFALVGIAVAVKFYQKRRKFYLDHRLEADWSPHYGSMVVGRLIEKILSLAFVAILFLGILILLRVFLPDLFSALFNTLLPLSDVREGGRAPG